MWCSFETEPGLCTGEVPHRGYVPSEAPKGAVRIKLPICGQVVHVVPVNGIEGKLDQKKSKVYKHLKSGWFEIESGYERGRGLQTYIKKQSRGEAA